MAKRAAKKTAKRGGKAKRPAAKRAVAKRAKSSVAKTARVSSAPKAAAAPKWKPKGLQSALVNLSVKDCEQAIAWWKTAFGAELTHPPAPAPDGKSIWHAEVKIDDTVIFCNDVMPGMPASKTQMFLYVPDVDATFQKAVDAGATVTMPLDDMFWGDRSGQLTDPFGVSWSIATRMEELSQEEMMKRGEEFAAKMAAQGGPPPSQPPTAQA
jgi:uncharacterized glyoxalase superfamily protein PhnB